jgi:hypothetical protein
VRNDWQWKQTRLPVTVFDLLVFETFEHQSDAPTVGRKVCDLGFADFLFKAMDGHQARERVGQCFLTGGR